MTEEISKLYKEARRFDESDLRQSKLYVQAELVCSKLEELLKEMYGAQILPALQEYADALYDIAELEAMHYFEQGYLMKQQ